MFFKLYFFFFRNKAGRRRRCCVPVVNGMRERLTHTTINIIIIILELGGANENKKMIDLRIDRANDRTPGD